MSDHPTLALPITRKRTHGAFTLHVLEAGGQRLDGGAIEGNSGDGGVHVPA